MPSAEVRPGLAVWDAEAPLAGIVVTEVGQGLSVAFCGRLLADYGATVVKVEHNRTGSDQAEAWGPALAVFLNAGKLSVAPKETTPPGRALLDHLVQASDVAVRFGKRLVEVPLASPGPVDVNLSWLGESGPWSAFLCDDFLAQHMSGMAFTSALRLAETSECPPRAVAGHLAEMVAGLTAANASVVGLFERDRTGTSSRIEIAITEALASFMRSETVTYSYGAGLVSRSKLARSPIAAPVFQQPTADGYVDLLIMQEAQWRALLEIIGSPAWGDDEIFATHGLRSEYWDALEPLLQDELKGVTTKHVYEEGQARGIAIAPINSVAQAAEAAQFADRGFFANQPTAAGTMRVPGPPFTLGDGPRTRRMAPSRGEHNLAVFRDWLGCTADELAGLASPEGD